MILVTGCAGFIGSHLTERLLAEGQTVVGVDDFNNYYDPKIKRKNISFAQKNSNFLLFKADIRNKKALQKIFEKNKIDKIVHLAARAGVRPSLEQPGLYLEVNVLGTLNLLELAKEYCIEQFVFASSSSVYGLNKPPFSENQKIEKTTSPYAVSKRSAELLCQAYAHKYSIPTTCLRFFTVYGPRGRPDMAVHKFTDAIANGKPVERYGKGDMKRDFTYIEDIVSGIMLSLEKPFPFEIINLGNNKPVELNRLIKIIEKNLCKKAIVSEKPVPKGDIPITYASISKAKRLLGWKPCTSIEKGIELFVQYYKENF
ncbi:MAG: GDP-mannose 4,6-dehydratase [Candidatus Diapherotrites archaeon]